MVVDDSGGCPSGDAEGKSVFGCVGGVLREDSCKQDVERVLVGRSEEGLEIWSCECVVSGSAPDNTGRCHSKASSSASFSVPPNPHVHLATWRGSRCVRPFRASMTCRSSDYG